MVYVHRENLPGSREMLHLMILQLSVRKPKKVEA